MQIHIRDLRRADFPALEIILDQTGLFPSDLLRPMAEPWLAESAPHHWLVVTSQERPVGFAYVEPERMTEGTYNLLAIAIDPAMQGRGVGKSLVSHLIQRLREEGGRILLVETSSLAEFAGTRAVYESQDFTQEARIRDFYSEGEDKLVYWKKV